MKTTNFCDLKYVEDELNEDNLNQLKKICLEVFEDPNRKPANQMLAGNIEYEYAMPLKGSKIILPIVSQMAKKLVPDLNYEMESLWINYQKKYEFNPIHNHHGMFSFVIWIQIPYNLEDEKKLNSCKNSNQPVASLFSLLFMNVLGELQAIAFDLDKKDAGKILLFPSKMAHLVYPFYTSDDYRISIAGNIVPTRKPFY